MASELIEVREGLGLPDKLEYGFFGIMIYPQLGLEQFQQGQ